MAEPIPYFSRAEGGLVMKSDGLNPVEDWNGVKSAFEDSGVPAPSAAVTVADSGTGGTKFAGPYFAYQRWLDEDGNVSNLSPVSSQFVPSESNGTITAATNASPIVVTSASHGLSNDDVVYISDVLGNTGANGVWTVANKTTDTFELKNSSGSGDYQSGGTWKQGTTQIDYSGFTVPTDNRVTKRQILRTKAFGASVVYVDVEDETLSGTTASSTTADADLGTAIPIEGVNGEDLELNRRGEPPNFKPYLVHASGRMLGFGFPIYSEGAVSVTNSSTSVTGVGTNFTDSMVGRKLTVVGDSKSYTIDAVNTSTQVLTLSANYTDTTDAFAEYSIQEADGELLSVYWSSTGLPEDWNTTDDTVALQEDAQSGRATGAMTIDRRIFFLFEHRIQVMSFSEDPSIDPFRSLGPQRGCVNNRCWVQNNFRTYMLDREGIYLFNGDTAEPLSDPIQDLFQPQSDSPYRIKWEFSDYFHSVHDPEHETVKFFVSLGGKYPRHSLNYVYSEGREGWWIEEYPFDVTSSCLARIGGRWTVLLGVTGKRVLAMSQGHLDGPDVSAGTVRGTVTSAGLTWIADTSASFASSGLVGFPVQIVAGRGRGQRRLVESVSGTTINVDQPWTVRPDTTSVYQLGAIHWTFRGGWHRFVASDNHETRAIEVMYKPLSSAAMFDVQLYRDRATTPYEWESDIDADGVESENGEPYLDIDATKDTGFVRRAFGEHRYTDVDGRRFVSVEVEGATSGERQILYQLDITGVAQ